MPERLNTALVFDAKRWSMAPEQKISVKPTEDSRNRVSWARSMPGLVFKAGLVIWILTNVSWGADQKVEIIRVTHREARGLLPLVTPLLGEEGDVSADSRSNSLVVVDTPERIRTIRDFVRTLDQPGKRLRVALQFAVQKTRSSGGIAADVRVRTGDSSIAVGRPGPEGAEVRVTRNRRGAMRSGNFFIILDSGGSAGIMVGEDIPHRSQWMGICRRRGHIARTVEFEKVDTGFDVQATALDKQVSVRITPTIAFRTKAGHGRVQQFADARTTLTIPMGKWVTVAGAETRTDEVIQAVLDSVRQNDGSALSMQVRVDPF